MGKGISAIISIVLLLMITISLIGFAWIWFTRLGSNLQNQTESGMEKTSQNILKRATIDNMFSGGNSVISIRNTGNANLTASDIQVYVNGQLKGCQDSGWNTTFLTPMNVTICTVSGPCTGLNVKVTTPGGSDERTC